MKQLIFVSAIALAAGGLQAGVVNSVTFAKGQPDNFVTVAGQAQFTDEGLTFERNPKSDLIDSTIGFGVVEKRFSQLSVSTTLNITSAEEKPAFDFYFGLGNFKGESFAFTTLSFDPEKGLSLSASDTLAFEKEVETFVLPYELIFKPIELETTIYDGRVEVVSLNGKALLKRMISDGIDTFTDVAFGVSGTSGRIGVNGVQVSSTDIDEKTPAPGVDPAPSADPAPAPVIPEPAHAMLGASMGLLGLVRHRPRRQA